MGEFPPVRLGAYAFFLPFVFQQLALAGDIAAVALGCDILAQGRNSFAGNHLPAYRRLNRHLIELTWNFILEAFADLPARGVRQNFLAQ